MIKFILSVFITSGLICGLNLGVYACVGAPSLKVSAKEAESVFIGKAVKVENVKLAMVVWGVNSPSNLVLFKPEIQKISLEVGETIKGKPSKTLEVLFRPSSCFSKFTNGQSVDLIVFAYKWSLVLNDESLLSEDNRLKQVKLKAEADSFNQGLPLLEVFALPLGTIKKDELEAIKSISKSPQK